MHISGHHTVVTKHSDIMDISGCKYDMKYDVMVIAYLV
jgi:hypothetical protein